MRTGPLSALCSVLVFGSLCCSFRFPLLLKKKRKCAVMRCRSLQLAPRSIDGSNYTSQNRTVYLADFMSVVATNCNLRIYNKALFSDFTNVSVGSAFSGSVP